MRARGVGFASWAGALLLGLLSGAAELGAAEVEIHLVDLSRPARRPLLSQAVQLPAVGGETRVGPTLVDGLEISLRLLLESESDRGIALALHVMATGRSSGKPSTGWTSRRFELSPGDAAELAVPGSAGRLSFRVRLPELSGTDAPTLDVLIRVTDDAGILTERAVVISRGSATVALGPEGAEPLTLTLTPRGRNLTGARLDVVCEGRLGAEARADSDGGGRLVQKSGSYAIEWGDALRIAGLEAPGGPLLLDLVLRP